MTIGNGGQIAKYFLTGVLSVHHSWRWRWGGDANIICRHRRHTCTSLTHMHGGNIKPSILKEINISSKTSSGRRSIVVIHS